MIRSAVSKVMWVGRATVFMVGLAVILALVVGVASAAFSATGGNIILGENNSANAPTTLVGNIVDTTKSALVLRNSKGGSALQLQVNEGKAPLKVNATAGKATNLNSDKLDGKDATAFMSAKTYRASRRVELSANVLNTVDVNCDSGDVATGSGYDELATSTHVEGSVRGLDAHRWLFFFRASASDSVIVEAVCADFPPFHR